jgi:minor histocompatibility antigen H13
MTEVRALSDIALESFESIKPLLPTYTHLILSALFPIYAGAHASLSRPSSADKPPKKSKDEPLSDGDEDEAKDATQKMEGLEPSDAIMFPLLAGLTLGGLYFIIKWLEDPAILNKILGFYFSQMGLFFTAAFLKDGSSVVRSFVFPAHYRHGGQIWKARQSQRKFVAATTNEKRASPLPGLLGLVPLPKSVLNLLWTCRGLAYQKATLRTKVRGLLNSKTRVGLLDVTSGIIALIVVAYFAFVNKPWWLTNLLGFSFCYGSLQFMSPSTFSTGSLILAALFLYDIYFVFFTPLMVTVATKLDVPIKLLIPRPSDPDDDPTKLSLAMLGLGDIVVPGMMMGLALRFDLFLYYYRKGLQKAKSAGTKEVEIKPVYQRATSGWGERFWTPLKRADEPALDPPYQDAQSFPKPYFYASVIGYTSGMVVTLLVMQYWKHAQPALLYLVPGVLVSLWGTALVRGELKLFWDFSDSVEREETTEGSKDPSTKKEKQDNEKSGRRGFFARVLSGDVQGLSSVQDGGEESEKAHDQKSEKKSDSPATSTIVKEPSGPTPEASNTHTGPSLQGRREEVDNNGEIDLFSISISLPTKRSQKAPADSTTSTFEAITCEVSSGVQNK